EQGELKRNRKQDYQISNQLQGFLEDDLQRTCHGILHHLYIRRDFGNDIAFPLVAEEADVHVHHVVEDIFPEVQQSVDSQVFHHALRQVFKYIAQQYGTNDDEADQFQCLQGPITGIDLFRIIIEISQNIRPVVGFYGCRSLAVALPKQGTEQWRQQG